MRERDCGRKIIGGTKNTFSLKETELSAIKDLTIISPIILGAASFVFALGKKDIKLAAISLAGAISCAAYALRLAKSNSNKEK